MDTSSEFVEVAKHRDTYYLATPRSKQKVSVPLLWWKMYVQARSHFIEIGRMLDTITPDTPLYLLKNHPEEKVWEHNTKPKPLKPGQIVKFGAE